MTLFVHDEVKRVLIGDNDHTPEHRLDVEGDVMMQARSGQPTCRDGHFLIWANKDDRKVYLTWGGVGTKVIAEF